MILSTEVLYDYENRLMVYGYGAPVNDLFPIQLMNDAVERLARETLCIERPDQVVALDERVKEGTYTADAGTNTTSIVDTELDSTTNDNYNGYRLTNITRGKQAWVTDYVGSTQTLSLSPAIVGQTTADEYYIENLTNRARLPRDFISEFYIHWGENNSPLIKIDSKTLRNLENSQPQAGTPQFYYIENNYLRLFPYPGSANVVHYGYYAIPHPVVIGDTSAVSTAGTEIKLSLELSKQYPAYRLIGAEIHILEGTYEGESSTITAFTSSTAVANVYPAFTGNIASGTTYTTLIDLPDDFQHGIKHFMLYNTLQMRKGFEVFAKNEYGFWLEFLEEAKRTMSNRKSATNLRLRSTSGIVFTPTITFDTSNVL